MLVLKIWLHPMLRNFADVGCVLNPLQHGQKCNIVQVHHLRLSFISRRLNNKTYSVNGDTENMLQGYSSKVSTKQNVTFQTFPV